MEKETCTFSYCKKPEVTEVDCDLVILGGGMAGCGAAYEACRWANAKGLKVVMVDKAATDRSGAVAMGLSAINTYIGENKCADYVKYVRNDLMGIIREDLVYDLGRHVDDSVHLFEEWGLPIWKKGDDGFSMDGHQARAAGKNVAAAIGFSTRENKIYSFKAKAMLCATAGAVNCFRPRSVGEGLGRTWYPVFCAGSGYAFGMQAGAEMTLMENRFVPARFKDGYGPVGAWFLFFKAKATDSYGNDYCADKEYFDDAVARYGDYAKGMGTAIRNHLMMRAMKDGKGPILMNTHTALAEFSKRITEQLGEKAGAKKRKNLEAEAWEDILDMAVR